MKKVNDMRNMAERIQEAQQHGKISTSPEKQTAGRLIMICPLLSLLVFLSSTSPKKQTAGRLIINMYIAIITGIPKFYIT